MDVHEGDEANQLPATINVGETKTVAIVYENVVNTIKYNALSSVSLTLRSKNDHFSVKTPTVFEGYLPAGIQIA